MARGKIMTEQKAIERITRGIFLILFVSIIWGIFAPYMIAVFMPGVDVLIEMAITILVAILIVSVSVKVLLESV